MKLRFITESEKSLDVTNIISWSFLFISFLNCVIYFSYWKSFSSNSLNKYNLILKISEYICFWVAYLFKIREEMGHLTNTLCFCCRWLFQSETWIRYVYLDAPHKVELSLEWNIRPTRFVVYYNISGFFFFRKLTIM